MPSTYDNSVYEDAHLLACANAITALGNRIGLYAGATKVGSAAVAVADTTWGTTAKITESGVDYARRPGSTVTITIPATTVGNGTVITHYGILNGTTLLRRVLLDVALTINNGAKEAKIDITPEFLYRGT